MSSEVTRTRAITVDDGVSVFYREAGSPSSPAILLLHGFPASSFQFRHLIPRLAEKYHVLAPDLPGYGFTVVPESRGYKYTFAALADTIGAFVDALKLTKYAIYIFDFGAPTGLRLMLSRPDSVTAIISQNGNAYVEGLGGFWDGVRAFWENPTPEVRAEMAKTFTSFETTKWQYVTGAPEPDAIPPETYHLDYYLMTRPGNADIQMDLIHDYENNLKLYPAFQEHFRTRQLPILAVWGKNDTIFVPEGAKAFKKDAPETEVHFVDGGHFALESHGDEIADYILEFLGKHKI